MLGLMLHEERSVYPIIVRGIDSGTLEALAEHDSDLSDTEQVPLLKQGVIEAFIRREVLPHMPDAWIKEYATKIGYEVSFKRHFYKPRPLQRLDEIAADMLAIDKDAEGLLDGFLKGGFR